ncbi:translation initiation factor IF-2-like [Cygnus atratus]|uniref:translation initiation factor IF-2-like n=1 Tax=Cygnus atratus TaxID=8868 RepID=UPI0021B7768E|nr:translation initiation factor IF-2-like [Cygnus atratus]XP_050564550.1 translation initiation factor IF-2-like [Cygnus atratus]XP_050564551.1 translation initiation factor IF-2-like [Cygnus atratus]
MRTRKPPCPVEKVWVDKHKYDEAERLHYEREATLAAAAAAPEECPEVEAVNGVCNDDPAEGELRGDPKRGRNGKKQRKRKRSPKPKGAASKADSVLSGLSADRVWFEKPFYDRAENLYNKKRVDCQSREAAETELAAERPAPKAVQDAPKPRMLAAALPCSHGSLSACHHLVQGVWVNKVDFDKAEKVFVERSRLFVPPGVLALPSVPPNAENGGPRTPDEGYGTALPTPATPSSAPDAVSPAPLVTGSPASPRQTVNGKPQASSLRALVAEVWLEKPLYDGAEKSFYENMFDGPPPEKAEQRQQRRCPEASKDPREDGKNPGAGQKEGAEHPEAASSSPPPSSFFLHEDSEAVWLSKPTYDRAESRHYAAEALKASREGVEGPQAPLGKPSRPAAKASTTPAPGTK